MAAEGEKIVDNNSEGELEPINNGLEQIHIGSSTGPPQRPHLLWNSKMSRSHPFQIYQNFSYLAKFNDRLSQCNMSKSIGSYLNSFWIKETAAAVSAVITALEWRPTRDVNVVVWGDNCGKMYLMPVHKHVHADTVVLLDELESPQRRPFNFNYIEALKWDSVDHQLIYAANSRTVEEFCVETKKSLIVWGRSHDGTSWHSLDESRDYRLIVAGDTHGNVVAFDKRSRVPAWRYRFYTELFNTVSHLEFNRVETSMLASVANSYRDYGVKLWDIRMLQNTPIVTKFSDMVGSLAEPVAEVATDRPLNIATFNYTGDLLLTSDEYSVRVYQGPNWKEIVKITHHHGQLWNGVPIASWHPSLDVIFVGRNPDLSSTGWPVDHQTIDVFCGRTGQLVTRMFCPHSNGVSTIVKMNPFGSMLACALRNSKLDGGSEIAIWTREIEESSPDGSENERNGRHSL